MAKDTKLAKLVHGAQYCPNLKLLPAVAISPFTRSRQGIPAVAEGLQYPVTSTLPFTDAVRGAKLDRSTEFLLQTIQTSCCLFCRFSWASFPPSSLVSRLICIPELVCLDVYWHRPVVIAAAGISGFCCVMWRSQYQNLVVKASVRVTIVIRAT
jgi:hypothetical protein